VQLGVRMYAFTLYAVWAFTGKTFITFDCYTRDFAVCGLRFEVSSRRTCTFSDL